MIRTFRNLGRLAARTARRRLLPAMLALALADPGWACAYNLNELLHLPLERLMQMEISPRRVALGVPGCAPAAHCSPADGSRNKRSARILLALLCLGLLTYAPAAKSDDLPEYRLKAAFLYNFAVFTEWPADVGSTLNLCVYGQDPFGEDLD